MQHARFLHDPARGWVAGEVSGVDAIHSQVSECMVNHGFGHFSGVALIPEQFAESIAEFTLCLANIGMQADYAQQ